MHPVKNTSAIHTLSFAFALALALAIALAPAGPARAAGDPPAKDKAGASVEESHGGWFSSWWPFGNGHFGLTVGGVTVMDGGTRIEGSDHLVHVPRAISGVHALELRAPVDVVIKQADVEKLTLHTDDNIAPLIETRVQDGVLHVTIQPGVSFHTGHAIGLTLEVPRLDAIRVVGSGDVVCAGLTTDLMEITVRGSGDVRLDALHAGAVAVLIQGSGDVNLSGTAARQGYVIEGSGDISAQELTGKDVAVRIAGSGDASVWATETLSVEIAGSGDVTYHGQPTVKKAIHGSGDLIHGH